MRNFSSGNIENIVLQDPCGDISENQNSDAYSTFDEENYDLGYDEDN